MGYFIEKICGPRREAELDPRFVTDLAAALGGSDVEHSYKGGNFTVGELVVYLRQGYGAKERRVTVSSGFADKDAHRRAYAAGCVPPFPSVTVDPDRPMDALTKDIRKRVVEAAAPVLEAGKALDAQQRDMSAGLKQHAEALNAKFPGAVTLSEDDTKREASVYWGRGVYLSGRLNYNGSLYVERVGSVPAHKVEALLRLLSDEGED